MGTSVHKGWEGPCHLVIELDGHLAVLLPQALYLLLVVHGGHLSLRCPSLELYQACRCGRELLNSLTLSLLHRRISITSAACSGHVRSHPGLWKRHTGLSFLGYVM